MRIRDDRIRRARLKLGRRMLPLVAVSLLLAAGLVFFACQMAWNGAKWTANPWDETVYRDGILSVGSVYDRDGTLLTTAAGSRRWAEEELTRISTLHAVGDASGNIGTGALSAFANQLTGYDFFNGLWSADGSGGSVTLSVDADLNRAAWSALGGQSGAVAVCDYRTGELLCMVSSPAYDPADRNATIPDGAYLNRFLSATYPPGSIYKIVTAIAAWEQLDDIVDQEFICNGSVDIDGESIACSGYHGTQKFEDAFAHSCNCAFAELANQLGGETLGAYSAALGMTSAQGVDGIQTASGAFDVYPAGTTDLSWSAIGQATDLICPAAMLRLVSGIANGGWAVNLTMLKNGNPLRASDKLMEPSTASQLDLMMDYAVAVTYGDENFPGLELRAKSGTAEVDGSSAHAWFVGYLADTAHPYAFVVIVENGGSGAATAGPVANAVLQAAVTD